MTTNADLIDETLHHLSRTRTLTGEGYNEQLLARLVEALEGAEREREQAVAELRDALRTDIPTLKDARDALQSRIDTAVRVITEHANYGIAPPASLIQAALTDPTESGERS